MSGKDSKSAKFTGGASPPTSAILALEDGRAFPGEAFGAAAVTATGEVCFNTSMTGYQEILTDPSYRGQIVCMTYPQIGNYGINPLDEESRQLQIRGFVVAELSPVVSNWRATKSLAEYLEAHGIAGIQGIDTRALTKHLRSQGAMRGCISTAAIGVDEAVRLARESPPMEGMDYVREVTPDAAFEWDPDGTASRKWTLPTSSHADAGCDVEKDSDGNYFEKLPPVRHRVVALDFGMKRNITRLLRSHGIGVKVVPATTSAAEILALGPDGVFLSNGPGDPAALGYAHETVRGLAGKVPVFGICLGHQIIALAFGGKTFKLKFGHRGANQPVQCLDDKSVAITSQNHGFAVDAQSLPPDLEVTHLNLNDNTVAGLRHKKFALAGVQFHPEASPGPHEASTFFAEFAKVLESGRAIR